MPSSPQAGTGSGTRHHWGARGRRGTQGPSSWLRFLEALGPTSQHLPTKRSSSPSPVTEGKFAVPNPMTAGLGSAEGGWAGVVRSISDRGVSQPPSCLRRAGPCHHWRADMVSPHWRAVPTATAFPVGGCCCSWAARASPTLCHLLPGTDPPQWNAHRCRSPVEPSPLCLSGQ